MWFHLLWCSGSTISLHHRSSLLFFHFESDAAASCWENLTNIWKIISDSLRLLLKHQSFLLVNIIEQLPYHIVGTTRKEYPFKILKQLLNPPGRTLKLELKWAFHIYKCNMVNVVDRPSWSFDLWPTEGLTELRKECEPGGRHTWIGTLFYILFSWLLVLPKTEGL